MEEEKMKEMNYDAVIIDVYKSQGTTLISLARFSMIFTKNIQLYRKAYLNISM